MAFDLPRAARSLRFTGQVRALVAGDAQPRRSPACEPPSAPPPRPLARPRTTRTPPPRAALGGTATPLASAPWDDDLPTTVAPRAADAAPPHDADRTRLEPPPSPQVRSARRFIPGGTHLTPTVPARHRRRGLPLVAWLVLSFVSATISYRLVPPVVEQLGLATQALER